MTPPIDPVMNTSNPLCPVCQKSFIASAEQTVCSDACSIELLKGEKEMAAARQMSREIQDLYNSYQVRERLKIQRINY